MTAIALVEVPAGGSCACSESAAACGCRVVEPELDLGLQPAPQREPKAKATTPRRRCVECNGKLQARNQSDRCSICKAHEACPDCGGRMAVGSLKCNACRRAQVKAEALARAAENLSGPYDLCQAPVWREVDGVMVEQVCGERKSRRAEHCRGCFLTGRWGGARDRCPVLLVRQVDGIPVEQPCGGWKEASQESCSECLEAAARRERSYRLFELPRLAFDAAKAAAAGVPQEPVPGLDDLGYTFDPSLPCWGGFTEGMNDELILIDQRECTLTDPHDHCECGMDKPRENAQCEWCDGDDDRRARRALGDLPTHPEVAALLRI